MGNFFRVAVDLAVFCDFLPDKGGSRIWYFILQQESFHLLANAVPAQIGNSGNPLHLEGGNNFVGQFRQNRTSHGNDFHGCLSAVDENGLSLSNSHSDELGFKFPVQNAFSHHDSHTVPAEPGQRTAAVHDNGIAASYL